jgi:hypothetical protein
VSHVGTIFEQAAAQVREGAAPLWFPEFSCGTPLAAAGMYGLLYPGLLLFAVLPLGAAWTWTAVIHLAWGAAGMHAFLRRRVSESAAGLGTGIFLLSEYLIGRTTCGHLNLVLPLCWTPWILRYAEGALRGHRRAVPILAICTGMGLLSGHLQLQAYLLPLVAAFAFREAWGRPDRRAAVGRLAAGLALGAGIAAAQLALTAELVLHTARTAPDLEQMRAVSVPPSVLAGKVLAALPGPAPAGESLDFRHEFRGIAGIWVFALAALGFAARAPRRWLWLGAIVTGAVLAMGLHVAPLAPLHGTWPVSLLRAPSRALVLVLLAASVLAAHGFDRIVERIERGGGARAAWLPAVLSLCVGCLAWAWGMPAVGDRPDATHRMDWAGGLPAEVRAHRVTAPRIEILSNVEAQGLATMRRPCPADVEGFAEMKSVPSAAVAYWLDLGAELTPRWDSAALVPPPEALASLEILPFPAMGRARVFGAARFGVPEAEVLERLRRGERDLYLDGPMRDDAAGDVPLAEGAARAHLVEESPRRTVVAVETPRAAWLLVSQVLYPGWEAEVDGAPAELRRGNLAFPAVRVPAGRHEVRLVYRPLSFRIGAAVSLACLGAALVGLFVRRRYAPPGEDADPDPRPVAGARPAPD